MLDCPQTLPRISPLESPKTAIEPSSSNPHYHLNSQCHRQVIFEYLCFFRTRNTPKTSTNILAMVLLLALTNVVFTDVHITTHLSDALDQPVFKKGAAFVFRNQAVTPEIESKVRVFSPFPKVPEINLTDAYTLLQTRGHTDSMTGMDTVKLCQTERMGTLYDQLFNRLEEKFSLIRKGINAAHTDQNKLIKLASFFLPPSVKPDHGTTRSKRAVGLFAAAAGATGLVLGSPVKDAACSALSIFHLCRDTKEQEENVDHVMATQKQFQAVSERVHAKNDENILILGNEIEETQKMCTENN